MPAKALPAPENFPSKVHQPLSLALLAEHPLSLSLSLWTHTGQTPFFFGHPQSKSLYISCLQAVASSEWLSSRRQGGDSNPCGQSPKDFESISLTVRTPCLGSQPKMRVDMSPPSLLSASPPPSACPPPPPLSHLFSPLPPWKLVISPATQISQPLKKAASSAENAALPSSPRASLGLPEHCLPLKTSRRKSSPASLA